MTKYHVANMLWRVLDRAIQVHGALGFSSDTPLEDMFRHARSARLVDGADEVHLSLIARNLLDWYKRDGSIAGYGTELLYLVTQGLACDGGIGDRSDGLSESNYRLNRSV